MKKAIVTLFYVSHIACAMNGTTLLQFSFPSTCNVNGQDVAFLEVSNGRLTKTNNIKKTQSVNVVVDKGKSDKELRFSFSESDGKSENISIVMPEDDRLLPKVSIDSSNYDLYRDMQGGGLRYVIKAKADRACAFGLQYQM